MRRALRFVHTNIKKHGKILAALLVGLVLGTGSSLVTYASIPDSNGQIHGCYNNVSGALRIIDSASASCSGGETSLNWDQSAGPGKMLSNLVGTSFNQASLQYRDFRGTDFHGSMFSNTDFTGSDLSSANFSGSTFNGGYLSNTNLQSTNFSSITTEYYLGAGGADLTNADFSNAVLANFDVSYAPATVSGADFSNTQFNGSNLSGTDFSGATFTGATWSNTTCPDGTNSDGNGNTCIGHLVP